MSRVADARLLTQVRSPILASMAWTAVVGTLAASVNECEIEEIEELDCR